MKTSDMKHDSAIKHVTGQSVYVNDMEVKRQLVGRVVYSPEAHARISLMDIKAALKLNGVVAILTHKDIPGKNQMGPVFEDELCLAEDEVTFIGQAIALIAAETEEAALKAEKLIRIEYEELITILDLREAIKSGSLIAPPRIIECGDAAETLKSAPHVISGELETGAQEHWYLETQSALAIPGEDREMFMFASSQNPAETQAIVAEVLGIAKNEVDACPHCSRYVLNMFRLLSP